MVNNILDSAQMEDSKLELKPEATQVRQVMWKIVQSQKTIAIAKGIELEMYNDPKIPKYLNLDMSRFTSVVMNLVANAIKFTESGGVKVTTT